MKNSCFQFAPDRGRVLEDTGLISLKKAKKLWKEYYPKAIEYIQKGYGVQMYIWTDMTSEEDFREVFIYIDNDFITDGTFIYPPKQTPIPIYL